MSNADRLRSWLGLPMSDKLVVIGPVGQRAPATSPQPSLAHPCQRIRSHNKRYTQQGAAFNNLNSVPQIASAPPASKTYRILHSVLRFPSEHHRLQKSNLHGYGAPHCTHPRVRTFTPDANKTKPMSYQIWSCAANTRKPLRPHPLLTRTTSHPLQQMSSPRRPPCL
jgi:hypothetical protein